MAESHRPIRVAIVGGGCAALTTAFELSRPSHGGRYEVTVFQQGWRLGGKGASGRGVADRIEEHGLHLWMGFYENAFRLMRECYAELDRDPGTCPISTWRDAFDPAPHVAVVDRLNGTDWHPWLAHFPARDDLPGDGSASRDPMSVRGYLEQTAVLLTELVRSALRSGSGELEPEDEGSMLSEGSILAALDAALRYGRVATAAGLLGATRLLGASLRWWLSRGGEIERRLLALIDAIAAVGRSWLDTLVDDDRIELRRIWQVIDLVLAIFAGSIRDGLAFDPRGFDAINDVDWRDWLRRNGASEAALDSGFMRGIYDLVFAYEDGDPERPSLAAGVALRGAMRMFFTCRGAIFWRMTSGMGDIVFAPIYEVLARRGTRFEFFHRLRDIRLSPKAEAPGIEPAEPPHVVALDFDVQAEILGGGPYQPLVDVRGLPCWPARPDYGQLVDGERIEREDWQLESPFESRLAGSKRLRVGEDFDFVVLGVGIGVVPKVASELVGRAPRWERMVRHVRTVATQAFQVWISRSTRQLGWRHPAVNLSGFVTPFDTWADMSHLISEESWQVPVRSLAYFCSVLRDGGADLEGPEIHREQLARVRERAVRFLEHDVAAIWPAAVDGDGRFRWDWLVVAEESDAAGGAKRFDSQFWSANVHPSERYTLSLPGTLRHRISPLDMDFDNLTVAGDWTQSGLDSSCVEAAVMSGLLAAHALSQSPPLEDIVGYDHP